MQALQPLFPDTILHIYCLRGDLPGLSVFPDGFLGNWQEDGYSFLFFVEPQDDFVAGLLGSSGELELEDRFTMSYRQWQGGFVEPLKIGRFLLTPAWLIRSAADHEIVLRFDPGLVFGNGTHPTTLACLAAIEIACAGGKIGRMLDLGTGSGLLALAAARLGCPRVVAVDNNLLAARTAQRNVLLNGLAEQVLVACGLARSFAAVPADLLVANIGIQVLREMLSCLDLSAQRWIVLSGLQSRDAQELSVILHDLDIVVLKHWKSREHWHTLLCITRSGR